MSITNDIDNSLNIWVRTMNRKEKDRQFVEARMQDYVDMLRDQGDVTEMSFWWQGRLLVVRWVASDTPLIGNTRRFDFSYLDGGRKTDNPHDAYDRAMRGI